MSHLISDLRFAVRTLGRRPGFTVIAVATLALGIGATTAIFSVVNTVLLRPLPYADADRIVELVRKYPGGEGGPAVSGSRFLYWRDHNRALVQVAAHDILGAGVNLTGTGEPQRIRAMRITPGLLDLLGVVPAAGRWFDLEQGRPGAAPAAILSEGLWQRAFGRDPALLGKSITLSGRSYTVVGIVPASFRFSPQVDVYLPLALAFDPNDKANLFVCLARLRPGMTRAAAQADLERVARDFHAAYPAIADEHESIRVAGFQEYRSAGVRPALLILLGAVALVLLIACANVANLLLVRAAGRVREIAVRAAIGADRKRIAAQLLTESLLISCAGAVVGVASAHWGLKWLLAVSPADLPYYAVIALDSRVLLFAVAITVLTGVTFGLAPALHAARLDLNDALKESGRSNSGGGQRHRVRAALVVAEVALSMVLLSGAALLIHSFARLRAVDPGFDPHNVLTMQMSVSDRSLRSVPAMTEYTRRLLDRIEALPGVEAAATVPNLPMELGPDMPVSAEGLPASAGQQEPPDTQWRCVTPHYFAAMRIPLRAGRVFEPTDRTSSENVAIVNETLARTFWPDFAKGRNVIGERITIGKVLGPPFTDATRQVVGVVGDVKEAGFGSDAPPTVFLPASQVPQIMADIGFDILPMTFVVRTRVAPLTLRTAIEREALALDRRQPMADFRLVEEAIGSTLAQQRFNMLLLVLFASIALALAAVGIYGVLAYSVAQRGHEIGIRMALGAARAEVLRMVVGEGMLLAGAGMALGTAAAWGLTRLLANLLYGVRPGDPTTMAEVAVVLLAVAAVACWAPAWRAARTDALAALRSE